MSQPGHCIVKTASTALDVKIRDPQSVWINFLHLFRDLHFREDVGQLVWLQTGPQVSLEGQTSKGGQQK